MRTTARKCLDLDDVLPMMRNFFHNSLTASILHKIYRIGKNLHTYAFEFLTNLLSPHMYNSNQLVMVTLPEHEVLCEQTSETYINN